MSTYNDRKGDDSISEMKTYLPKKSADKTRTIVTLCPNCNGNDLRKDYKREELYCNSCGLVLSSAVQYVGLTKIQNIVPYSVPMEVRDGVQIRWHRKEDLGKTDPMEITRHRHNMSDDMIMRKGRGRRKR